MCPPYDAPQIATSSWPLSTCRLLVPLAHLSRTGTTLAMGDSPPRSSGLNIVRTVATAPIIATSATWRQVFVGTNRGGALCESLWLSSAAQSRPCRPAGALDAYARSALAILPLRVLVTKGFRERIF